MATSIALVVPVMSFTEDAADEVGVVLDKHVDGSTRYLKIDNAGLSLVSALDDACLIQAVPGTGVHAGEICLKSADGTALTYNRGADDAASAFSVGGSTGSEWLRFAEISELTSDYFRTYSAKKVSVSAVPNGEKIIFYTRFWNEDAKRYEIYAINSDGQGRLPGEPVRRRAKRQPPLH